MVIKKFKVRGWTGGDFADYADEYHDENDDDEFGVIPHSSPIDFGASLSNGIDGILPSDIQFQGRTPIGFNDGTSGGVAASPAVSSIAVGGGGARTSSSSRIPSLKPNEQSGSCQRYTGSVCSEYIGGGGSSGGYIFVSEGLTQHYIEGQLKLTFKVIKDSPLLSQECAKYAIPAVCLSTLPLCDMQTQRPRKVISRRPTYTLLLHSTHNNLNTEYRSATLPDRTHRLGNE